ncbi:MAG: FAD-dependent oxidoreductase [Candidatus Woesearchaeota archaeon]
MVDYDVIVIGGGAAGLTAALYTSRKQLKTAIISIDIGGQTNLTSHIENYPGVDPQPGPKLMQKFFENARSFGAELIFGKVVRVDKEVGNTFLVKLDGGKSFSSRAVILAYGKVPRKLGIPGEEKFLGKGLSTCVTCDAPLFRGKDVAVIGGGNSAVEGAIELASIAKKVYIVHRRDSYKADEISVQKMRKLGNVVEVLNSQPVEIKGDQFVSGLVVENVQSKERKELAVNGVFSEIGYVSDVSAVAHLVKLNEQNEVVIDERCRTSVPGVFAAGDITQVPYKQTVIAAGEGAKAALEAHRWLTGAKSIGVDWTR